MGATGSKTRARAKRKTARRVARPATPRKSAIEVLTAFLPAAVSLTALVGLIAVAFVLYTNAAASGFFDLKSVEIYGVVNAPADEIEMLVRSQVGRTGVWKSDLAELKQKIEKVPYVRNAAIARRLPAGIVVNIAEREPIARVRIGNGEFLVDRDGEVLAPSTGSEANFPFLLVGWETEKSERALRENLERLKIYQAMLSEWRDYQLAARVKSVDLANLRDPRAVLEDSGFPITIALGRDNFGRRLSDGIKAIVGKGDIFEAVEFMGPNIRLIDRKQKR